MHTCLNCGERFEGNYCPNCGQSAKTGPLKLLPAIKELIPIIYSFDNRLLRTIKQLFTRPGHMIREYIEGHRICYYKPITLIFLMATIYLVAFHFLNGVDLENHIIQIDNEEFKQFWEEHKKLFEWVQSIASNKAWVALFSVTLWLIPYKVTFGRTEYGRNYSWADLFYSMIYLHCLTLMIDTCGMLINHVFDVSQLVGIIVFVYTVVMYKQLFKISGKKAFWLTILAWIIFLVIVSVLLTIGCLIAYYCGLFDIIQNMIDSEG